MVSALCFISWTASAIRPAPSAVVADRAHERARGAAHAGIGEFAVGAGIDRVLDRGLVRAAVEGAGEVEDLHRLVGAFRARPRDLLGKRDDRVDRRLVVGAGHDRSFVTDCVVMGRAAFVRCSGTLSPSRKSRHLFRSSPLTAGTSMPPSPTSRRRTLLKRLALAPVAAFAMVVVVFDDLVRSFVSPAVRWLASLRPVQRIESAVAALPPYATLALFLIPMAIIWPI